MTREYSVEESLSEALARKRVGEQLKIGFGGVPKIVTVRLEFAGGWVITQKLPPGTDLDLVKGEDGYLQNLTITIEDYEGLR